MRGYKFSRVEVDTFLRDCLQRCPGAVAVDTETCGPIATTTLGTRVRSVGEYQENAEARQNTEAVVFLQRKQIFRLLKNSKFDITFPKVKNILVEIYYKLIGLLTIYFVTNVFCEEKSADSRLRSFQLLLKNLLQE